MLSNRMTANSRDENPDSQANRSTANVIKLLQPAVFALIVGLGVFILICGGLSAPVTPLNVRFYLKITKKH